MKLLLCVAVLVAVCYSVDSKKSPPKVTVYSEGPGEYGKENTIICQVSNFYPPDITIELLKNQETIPEAKQTDLVFGSDWHFRLLNYASFTPSNGDKYCCRVIHGGDAKEYAWEPNM
ncbi:beta-2-microglobulin-like [Pholidichthys leucotaenia]